MCRLWAAEPFGHKVFSVSRWCERSSRSIKTVEVFGRGVHPARCMCTMHACCTALMPTRNCCVVCLVCVVGEGRTTHAPAWHRCERLNGAQPAAPHCAQHADHAFRSQQRSSLRSVSQQDFMPRRSARMRSCTRPSVDFAGLQAGSAHRHTCHVLRKLCFFNATLVPFEPGEDARLAQHVAQTLVVRSQFGSHQKFPLAHLHPMNVSAPTSLSAQLIKLVGLSDCVALYWVPTWAFSFADSFVSSLVPIDELQSAGLLDDRVLLRPDLWAWPRSKNPVYRMIGSLSSQQIRSSRETAPPCQDDTARRVLQRAAIAPSRELRQCRPHCFEKVVICQFRSTFDAYEPPMAPWRAGQRVAASVLSGEPQDAASALTMGHNKVASRVGARRYRYRGFRPEVATEGISSRSAPHMLRVLFVNRTRTKFSRSLANLPELLDQCVRAKPRSWPRGWVVGCATHEFGTGNLAADVRAARSADVLVGTHGAGLINSFFMRHGGVLIEVRPYHFEGSWPDKYFRALTSLEKRILYLQVSSGSPGLSIPRPNENVSVWDARDHAVILPWRTLKDALQVALHLNGSRDRYVQQLWTRGATFVSSLER